MKWQTSIRLVSLTLTFLCTNTLLEAASFTPLGVISGSDQHSASLGVSPDGSVVVGQSKSILGSEAFIWTAAVGIQGLGDFPGGQFTSNAPEASVNGQVVVGSGTNSVDSSEAFRWTSSGGLQSLGFLPGGGASTGWAISSDGNVIVGDSSSSAGLEAFRWTETEGMQSIGDLPGGDHYAWATGISADGEIIVGSSFSSLGLEAFRWTIDDGMQGLGDLSGSIFESRALDVSADGTTIVGISESSNGDEAFIWTETAGMVGLGDLTSTNPGGDIFYSIAEAVSADGGVVVGQATVGNTEVAFIWTPDDGMQTLQSVLEQHGLSTELANWQLFTANGISDDGTTIVGTGTNPNGDTEAWVVVIPEPNTVFVLLVLSGCHTLTRRV